ncbi:MAG TPA: heme-binding domain-containing protein [Bacteroidia bacterium]|nr:heme-binding domain-containing protein [Bacteroidia bacterium]HNU33902.1 heme-binding domain-containing protein [Bacteroidia bacterium]
MSLKKKILIGIVALLVVIQFIKPERNEGEVFGINHISNVITVPADVSKILVVSCNDCHSNQTYYPWYANIQPVAWWLAGHVNDGKKHLNFSEFATYSAKKQNHKMEEIAEMIEKHEMPLGSYTLVHTDAVLNAEQQRILIDWAKANYKPGIE